MTRERPLLYSAPMVRATLDDLKSQTRRIMKPQPTPDSKMAGGAYLEIPRRLLTRNEISGHHAVAGPLMPGLCPYGKPGERLWVRETHFAFGRWETRFSEAKGRDEWHFVDMTIECGHRFYFAASEAQPDPRGGRRRAGATPDWWKRPAIFMPRVASRITLEITEVRVERLQDISEADAIAEGARPILFPIAPVGQHYRRGFADLWISINGDASWDANPWVWAVSFVRVQP